jgi:hypothetical protein
MLRIFTWLDWAKIITSWHASLSTVEDLLQQNLSTILFILHWSSTHSVRPQVNFPRESLSWPHFTVSGSWGYKERWSKFNTFHTYAQKHRASPFCPRWKFAIKERNDFQPVSSIYQQKNGNWSMASWNRPTPISSSPPSTLSACSEWCYLKYIFFYLRTEMLIILDKLTRSNYLGWAPLHVVFTGLSNGDVRIWVRETSRVSLHQPQG